MLLNPLALFLSAAAIPIILMYVLKLRRRELIVPSTFLWRRALEDVQANTPWQRLRPSVLLLLQLLALAAAVIALAQPGYTQARAFSGDLVVIVDISYAMQIHDVTPSRFDAALSEARHLASNLSDRSVMTVIGMGAQPQLALAESSDKAAINRSIDALTVGATTPNFLSALSLAASLTRDGSQTRVVVLTSRDSGITAVPVRVHFPVTIVRLGGQSRDLGIVDLRASADSTRTQAVLRIQNFGAVPRHSDIDLYADDNLVDVRPVQLKQGAVQNLVWTHLPSGIHVLRAHITKSDDMSLDKSAWAILPTHSARRVLLVSSGNYFLQTALALDPSVQLSLATPQVYSAPLSRAYDLVVLDGFLPRHLPETSTLVVDPPQGSMDAATFGPLQKGSSLSAKSGIPDANLSAILRDVDLGDVHVAKVRVLSMPDSLQTLAVSGDSPVMTAGLLGTVRLAVISFDLQRSDWPLRISFPVAIQNLLHYLAPGLALSTSMPSAGHPVSFFPEPGTNQIRVTRPDGGVATILPPFSTYTATQEPGLYSVQELGRLSHSSLSFAVNVFHPQTRASVGRATITFGHARTAVNHTVRSTQSLAWVFGAASLLFLAAEWWFAFRR